jgi:hypothetical protein
MNEIQKHYDRQFFGYCEQCGSTQTAPIAEKYLIDRLRPQLYAIVRQKECIACSHISNNGNLVVMPKFIEGAKLD